MESILNHRTLVDFDLLIREFFIKDWLILAIAFFVVGLIAARFIWYRPRPKLDPNPQPKTESKPEPPAAKGGVDVEAAVGSMFIDEAGDAETPRRIAYIVDVSFSLTPVQFHLSKEELKNAIKQLNENSHYEVIFFSRGVWFAHQEEEEIMLAEEELITGKWLPATTRNKNKTLRAIDKVRKSEGTTWDLPVKLAMNLDPVPDAIFFHTDGQKKHHQLLAREIVKLIKRKGGRTKIHTIALMNAKAEATKSLKSIARRTGGKFSLVTKR